jgi:hypothetical protein
VQLLVSINAYDDGINSKVTWHIPADHKRLAVIDASFTQSPLLRPGSYALSVRFAMIPSSPCAFTNASIFFAVWLETCEMPT